MKSFIRLFAALAILLSFTFAAQAHEDHLPYSSSRFKQTMQPLVG